MLAKIAKLTNWQAAIIIALVGFAVFFVGLDTPFMGDDLPQIVNNVPVHSIAHIGSFFDNSTFYNGQKLSGTYYRPLMTTVFSLLYTLFGPHPFYFHLFQVLLCIGSAIVVFLIFRKFFNIVLALLLSLAFLVHPINSQAAFEIPTMQDALFFFFGILGFYLILHYDSVKILWLVVLCFLLSLLSKETGVLFVILALIYFLWFEKKRLSGFAIIMAGPLLVWLLLHIHVVGLSPNPHGGPIDNLGLSSRLLTAPSIVGFYLNRFIFPWRLATQYYWIYPTFSISHVLLPLLLDLATLVVAIGMAIVIRTRVSRELYCLYVFAMVWTLFGIAINLQIIPLDMTASITWFYFASVGIFAMIGVIIVAFQSHIHPGIFLAVFIGVLVLFGVRTVVRGTDFSNQYKLAYSDIAASPDDYSAYSLTAIGLDAKGNYQAAKTYDLDSIHIYPDGTNYATLGYIYDKLGDYTESEQADEAGLSVIGSSQSQQLLYDNAARLMVWFGKPANNEAFIKSGLKVYPNDANLWLDLAIILYQNGDKAAAKSAITQAYTDDSSSEIAAVYSIMLHDQSFTLAPP